LLAYVIVQDVDVGVAVRWVKLAAVAVKRLFAATRSPRAAATAAAAAGSSSAVTR
jgi:hypothetical protein